MRYPTPATVAMIEGGPSRLRKAETVMRTALVNGSAFSSQARSRSSSALITPPSAATRTSSTAQVQVALDPAQQTEVHAGGRVAITLPDGKPVTGKVDRIGRVAQVPAGQNQNTGAATIPAYISLDDPEAADGLDRAPVQVD